MLFDNVLANVVLFKPKYMKKYIYIFFTFTFLFVTPACLNMRKSDKKILRYFKKNGLNGQVKFFDFENKSIRYVVSKPIDKQKISVLFVHGAPGSSTDFEDYLNDKELNKLGNLISIDRIGYGYSDFGNSQTSIQTQAKAIEKLIDIIDTPFILVGWSFGGPIAGFVSLNKSKKIKHLILLAPAISPESERFFQIGKLAQSKWTKWMVPTPFVMAQEEKMMHEEELEKLKNKWQNLIVPTTYLHGSKDKLVPYEGNMNFVKKTFNDSILNAKTIDGYGHIFPVTNSDIVKKEIMNILKKNKFIFE